MCTLPISDEQLAQFVEFRASKHRKGMAGYLRDLVIADRKRWYYEENVRAIALSKLTEEERVALGFPPRDEVSSDSALRPDQSL